LALLLAGCKGVPTKGEKEARNQAQTVAVAYRPQGQRPALPIPMATSSLSNLLTCARLNQPKVELKL